MGNTVPWYATANAARLTAHPDISLWYAVSQFSCSPVIESAQVWVILGHAMPVQPEVRLQAKQRSQGRTHRDDSGNRLDPVPAGSRSPEPGQGMERVRTKCAPQMALIGGVELN